MNNTDLMIFMNNIREKYSEIITNKLKEQNLKELVPSHSTILYFLLNNNGVIKMSDIANLIGRKKSTVTVLVDKLVKMELVQKCECTVDGRVTYLKLTDKGYELKPLIDEISKELCNEMFVNLTPEESEIFMILLKKMCAICKG